MDLTDLDPSWAWAPYEPDARHPWGIAQAAHLHRRAGFAASWPQLQESVAAGPAKAIERLFQADATPPDAPDLAAFDSQMEQLGGAMIATGDPRQLSAWWLYRMLYTPRPLLEKTTLFWHNHFATSAAKVTESRLMIEQNALLRRHALGEFEPLVQAISRDPAMLIWLDSTTNRKVHPNENFARELMELFCLGPGNYTERDIKEVARAFTGWEVRRGKFVFNKYQHDTGAKSFLGKTGNFDGDEAVRIVLAQPAAPRFIAAKLARWFVCEEPRLPGALIEPLAAQLRENGFDVGPVVRRMLSSNLFFNDHAVARKVRSPVELSIGLLRSLEATADLGFLAGALDNLGQAVFFPPNVKGWDGGRTWISSASLLARANLVRELVLGGKARYTGPNLAEQCERDGMTDSPAAVDRLLRLLLPIDPPRETRASLIDLAEKARGDINTRLARVVHAIATLPEFQLI